MLQNRSPKGIKTIYLIRHGQTDYNKRGIIQGAGVDTNLNEHGELQAIQFFRQYKEVPFQRIYASMLKRTHQTIAPFRELNIPVEFMPELNEINWGIMEGAVPTEETTAEFVAILKEWRNGNLDTCVQNGETPLALFARQQKALSRLLSDSESPVLVCMHGRAMRSFLCLLTGHPLKDMDDFEHGNVCLYILEQIPDTDTFRILVRNSRAHLHDKDIM
ncbi:MAG: histidine phosphatase family protein [Bacteroidetes bacterium]|nr:histidine phosphatase family protein [Bacteroidota bacterium]